MKVCFVFAVLFFAANAPVKPNQSSNHSNSGSNGEREPSVVVVHNEASRTEASDRGNKAPKWDASIWAVLANWALVVVGIFTFLAILQQAKDTAEAARATRASAKAAEDNIGLIVSKERARLKISFKAFEPFTDFPEIFYKVIISGATDAFNVQGLIFFSLVAPTEDAEKSPSWGVPLPLPGTIPSKTPDVQDNVRFPHRLNESEVEDINRGRKHVHIQGFFRYKDVFDNTWTTEFHKMWVVIDLPFPSEDAKIFQYWKDLIPEEEKKETKAN